MCLLPAEVEPPVRPAPGIEDRELRRWWWQPGVVAAQTQARLLRGLGPRVGQRDELAGLAHPAEPDVSLHLCGEGGGGAHAGGERGVDDRQDVEPREGAREVDGRPVRSDGEGATAQSHEVLRCKHELMRPERVSPDARLAGPNP